MDAFTQRMLERAQARRVMLDKQLTSVGQQTSAKKRTPLLENHQATSDVLPTELGLRQSTPSPTKGVVKVSKIVASASPKRQSQGMRRHSSRKSPRKEATPPPPTHPVADTESDEGVSQTESDSEKEGASESGSTQNKGSTEKSDSESSAAITTEVRSRLRRLGALYSDSEQLSSPIHRTENSFSAEPVSQKKRNKSATRSARLAALANTINQWEDDLSHPSVATAAAREKTPSSAESQGFTRSTSNSRLVYDFEEKSPNASIESNIEEEEEESPRQSPVKKDVGSPVRNFAKFTSPTRSPLVMGIAQLRSNSSPVKQSNGSPSKGLSSPVKSQFKSNLKPINVDESKPEGSVLQRAAKYESEASSPAKRLAKDPAELPLSERMALFEKNKGPLLVPKVPFSTPMPAKLLKVHETNNQQYVGAQQKSSQSSCPPIKEPIVSLPNSSTKMQSKQTIEESAVLRRLQLFESGKVGLEESPSRPQNQAVAERQKEMELLSNRWNRNKDLAINETSSHKTQLEASPVKAAKKLVPGTPPPPPPPMPGSPLASNETASRRSPRRLQDKDAYPGVSMVKRIKVSPPKPGCLYPSLSDVEATTEAEDPSSAEQSFDEKDAESSLELDPADNSFGKDILEAAEKVHSSYRSNKDSMDELSVTESTVLRDMDDFLEEALDESSDDEHSPTPPKKTRITPSKKSDSFQYKAGVDNTPSVQTIERKSPRRASTKYRAPQPPCTPSSDEQQIPLVHTVSFYRKQQNMTPRSSARLVQRQPTPEKTSGFHSDDQSQNRENERNLVEVRVRSLLDDVSKQQTVISQASQALNLCNATVEFSGSAEQVEGERLLLLATHKRQAALNEIQRLKVEGTLRPQNPSGHDLSNFSEHGTLHISDITLPVKRDFVRSIAAEDNSHHFVCLAKCQDVVLSTSVLSVANTRDLQGGQALRFSSSLTLPDLYSSFKVTLEIYTMTCRKEMLPHDIKYHINKKDKHRMTPKKQKQDSHLLRPPVQSPAGPGAVRSPQFALIGYVIFSLREIQRTSFTLNKVPYTSPLEGSIQLRMQCDLSLDIEHRGFLTMYEVVSGYGAWHRRWCLLKGEMLSYWKYPDHERKEVPIGSIDLRSCVNENVGLVSRDLCARPHTFLLETSRPAKASDEDSLDMVCKGDVTHIRHLLSADTREERVEWCNQLNKALTVIRAWGKKSDM